MSTHAISQIVQRDPADLKPHPLVKAMPRWAQDDPEFHNFSDDIAANGIKNPIKITKDNQVIDGETRRLAAKKRALDKVPCVIVEDEEIFETIVRELVFRRQLTKSGLAYTIYPAMAPAFEEARKKQLSGRSSARNALLPKTVEDLSESVGISRRLFFQAQQVHQAFKENEELRTQFEHDIITGETYLGAVLAGIAGQKSTKGKAKVKEDQLDLFKEGLETIQKRFRYWDKFDETDRDDAVKCIDKAVAEMPPEVRKAFARAIKRADKEPWE